MDATVPNLEGKGQKSDSRAQFEIQNSKYLFTIKGRQTFFLDFSPFRKRKGEMAGWDRLSCPCCSTWHDPAAARTIFAEAQDWNNTAVRLLWVAVWTAMNVGKVLGFLLRKIGPGRGRNGSRWWAAGLERCWAD
ncbi:hypothetical protein KY284_016614 [Solanum tuberosum]|nr:hypothetical protein KY284_016614 [Solanum tuberosum]